MVEHNNPALRARQDLGLRRMRARVEYLNERRQDDGLHAAMVDKLLRAIDRRDPWNATDLKGWLVEHFPDFLSRSSDPDLKVGLFAEAVASAVKDDPAFPLIVANLYLIAAECDATSKSRAGG
jgi:hypothetical protein